MELRDFGKFGYPIPSKVRDLHRDLVQISRGIHVIPKSSEERAIAMGVQDDWPIVEMNIEDRGMRDGYPTDRKSLEADIYWAEILKLRTTAK